ncbi:ComEA family DNA-binding protein [Leucobacter albus]|uniref:ComEA family DNA-binding protein n=1 Tax=Leucobacter albus TaxID=272210 RepID=A0ABW3TJ71_9MICO
MTLSPREPVRLLREAALDDEYPSGDHVTPHQQPATRHPAVSAADGPGGRWKRAPAVGGGPDPHTWAPELPPWRRFVRGVNLPAALGVGVFVLAIAVTAIVMLRSLGGGGAELSSVGAIAPPAEAGAAEIAADGVTGATSGPAGGVIAAGEQGALLVHIVGEVERPGVVELPAGSRVLDAITEAGGPTAEAELGAVNLARQVSDGGQILIPNADIAADWRAAGTAGDGPSGPGGGDAASNGGTGAGSSAAGGAGGLVNVNTGGVDQLTQLPGIGPALAQRIIDWRESNGAFGSVDQLLEVSGIGQKTLEKFRDRVGL